jgi:hypothetical protein
MHHMHYGSYDAQLGNEWRVSLRIDDDMFDSACASRDQNVEENQYNIITLFRRECMIKYNAKPDRFDWTDPRFAINRSGDARPLPVNRKPYNRNQQTVRYGCTCERTPVLCGLCHAGHHQLCKYNCEFGNVVH